MMNRCVSEADMKGTSIISLPLHPSTHPPIHLTPPTHIFLNPLPTHPPTSPTPGIPDEYLENSVRKFIEKTYAGTVQQQYYKVS